MTARIARGRRADAAMSRVRFRHTEDCHQDQANVKTLVIVIVSILGTLGLIGGIAGPMIAKRGLGAGDGETTDVRVERAARGPLVELVSVPGEVQPEPQLKVPISARVSARIVELPYKEWDTVTKGNPDANPPVPPSVLVRLDSKDVQATLRSVQARYAAQGAQVVVTKSRIESQRSQIAANEASLKDATRDLRRQQELRLEQDVAQSVVDTAQTKVDELTARLAAARHDLKAAEQELVVLQHQLKAAEADIERAQEDVNNTVITSPIDGVVTKLRMKVGELAIVGIENNSLTNIMEVADLSRMVMIARVDETNVAALKVGQRATVRMPAYRDEVFEGTVDSVSPAIADMSRGMMNSTVMNFFEAKIRLKTDGRRIYSGLTADADIETSRHDGIRVPSQAVLGRPLDALPDAVRNSPAVQKDKSVASVVFRMIDGKAVATPVVVGASDETHTLIKSGLDEGAEVIVGPYKVLDALKHDQKVKKLDAPATGPTTQPVTTAPTIRAGD
jgi:HlyD family secretion protein